MSGSLNRSGGENVPGIPDACATHSFTYLARSRWKNLNQCWLLANLAPSVQFGENTLENAACQIPLFLYPYVKDKLVPTIVLAQMCTIPLPYLYLYRLVECNSLIVRPIFSSWQHISRSTMAPTMSCCWTTPSHNPNQCELILSTAGSHVIHYYRNDIWRYQ